ncbi:MAG: hypothetical protein AW09_004621 [Candidatus Accumulibacter phosphatis]|uniref:Uncharacterized protein n=1 Tax=Candidatus Accumulibacter phosphatis TaxID=327160 RepID=A0A084Y6E9_9PROT|nr:MAG: hypothetical protein AW09_004621 [Candidatus Accumulibacter phosphatis]
MPRMSPGTSVATTMMASEYTRKARQLRRQAMKLKKSALAGDKPCQPASTGAYQ